MTEPNTHSFDQKSLDQVFKTQCGGNRRALVGVIAKRLLDCKGCITLAESCTGGLAAASLVDEPGSSRWFGQSWVTYSNRAKIKALGIDTEIIKAKGAVSQEVVAAMAEGARRQANAYISVAISGVAGPTGGTDINPVGSVWIAWQTDVCERQLKGCFEGDRLQVRQATVDLALTGVLQILSQSENSHKYL